MQLVEEVREAKPSISLVAPPGLLSEFKMLEREILQQRLQKRDPSSPLHTTPPSVCLGAAWA